MVRGILLSKESYSMASENAEALSFEDLLF